MVDMQNKKCKPLENCFKYNLLPHVNVIVGIKYKSIKAFVKLYYRNGHEITIDDLVM